MTQTTLGGGDFVSVAIKRLQQHEPPDGYYLAFSGGKDSVCCYHLAAQAGVAFESHYAFTTMDPPELVSFIRKHYPNTVIHRPKYKGKPTNFYDLVATKGLPNRRIRWCCSILKESGGNGRTVVTGVRRAESTARANRAMYHYMPEKKSYILNPIIDWTTADVWDYIHEMGLPYCELYDQGYDRIGCILCPLACIRKRYAAYLRYPKHVKAVEKAVARYIEKHPDTSLMKWGPTPKEIVYMWIAETPGTDETGQCSFGGI